MKRNNNIADFELLDYQEEAVRKNEEILYTKNDRFAGVVMSTGAGKSFVAMKAILNAGGVDNSEKSNKEEINNSTIYIVAPQNEILLGFKRNITEYILGLNPDDMGLNQMENEAKDEDEIKNIEKMKIQRMEEAIKRAFPNLHLVCYQTLAAQKETLKDIKPDLVIIDEDHRSGAPEFQKGVAELIGCKIENGIPKFDNKKINQILK